MRLGLAGAILILFTTPALPHRLDEYLQGTIISVDKTRFEAQMTLTPGVAVFPLLIPSIDTDADGVISTAEQRTYAERVLGDLSLNIDGHRLTPHLLSIRFPAIADMKEGRGEIQLDFYADLPDGGRNRKFTLENHHESTISAYQVNCLVPRDPYIRIAAPTRNYSQSLYELEYLQTDISSDSAFFSLRPSRLVWLSTAALLLFTRLLFFIRRRA